jgi:hypothetical protein
MPSIARPAATSSISLTKAIDRLVTRKAEGEVAAALRVDGADYRGAGRQILKRCVGYTSVGTSMRIRDGRPSRIIAK